MYPCIFFKCRIYEDDQWHAIIYYPFKQPVLPRVCGYMTNKTIMKLPTKEKIKKELGLLPSF